MKLVKVVFLIILSIAGCTQNQGEVDSWYEHETGFVTEFKRHVFEKYGLHCCASGGAMRFDLQSIKLVFHPLKHLPLDDCRSLFVAVTEDFVSMLNADKTIRPYLREFPANIENTKVSLSFPRIGFGSGNKYISHVFIAKKRIFYYVDEPDSSDPSGYKSYELLEEPYSEALRIVRNSSNSFVF